MNANLTEFPLEGQEIELQVLGEIFHSDDAAIYAFESLKPENFATDFAREIFTNTINRFNNGLPYDGFSVTEDCQDVRESRDLLLRVLQSVISTDNYKEHIRLVKRNAMRREMAKLSTEASDLVFDRPSISEMQSFMANSMERFGDDGIRPSMSALDGIQYFIDNIGVKRDYIRTNITPIDNILKISRGDYIILGARPSVGKTAFALQIAWQMGWDYKVVFYSFETSLQKIYDRIVTTNFGVSFDAIVNCTVSDADKLMVEKAKKAAEVNKLEVVEASGMTVSELQASAVRKKADIIFIDYLGLVTPASDQQQTSYEAVTKISKDLHTMAQKRKIALFVLSQLNRAGDDEQPTLTSLRDSGQIEQDADAVLLLSRIKIENAKPDVEGRRVQIAKNKEGTLGAIDMSFVGKHQRFVPIDYSRKE